MESPFEIERVEWVPATAEALEVHVYGRWRDGAPDAVSLLVTDAGGERMPFAAIAAAVGESGTWQARFAVPVELRSRLSAKLALQAGERELALPAASPGPVAGISAPPPATVVEPTVLEKRRAAREGAADEALVRRAQAAEATVSTLETQLDHLESRLREALTERERLGARLRAAEQREEAERRVRGEAEDERDALRAEVERQVSELRARARAAEEHAEALGAEMDEIRREAAEAQHAAAAARLAAERAAGGGGGGGAGGEAAQAELDRLTAETGELARRLDSERALRAAAESQLARQSERVAEVEATVTLLEHELDRRATVQTTVQSELEGLRQALAVVRTQTEETATREGSAQRTLAELQSTAAGLRERITGLEATERAARNELRSAQAELAARGRDLERAKIDVERSRAELASAHAAQDSTAAALREAERTVVAVRAEAAELQAKLDDERRRRFEAEATLKAEMERERERWGAQIAEIEGELHARIASERHAFEQQAAAIEQLVVALRQRLSSAGEELEERLAAAYFQRDEALAERDAALADADRIKLDVAGDLERAAAERELLLARVAEAEALVGQARTELEAARAEAASARDDADTVRAEIDARVLEIGAELAARLAEVESERDAALAELDARDAEITRLRGAADDAATRDAAIEALVADVVATAGSLRDDFDRQLAELHDRVEAELSTLRAQLEEERTARIVAEQELATERRRGIGDAGPSILDAMSRTELEAARRELAAAQEQLAAERRRSAETDELREHASKLVADLEAANARLKIREVEPPEGAPAAAEVPSEDAVADALVRLAAEPEPEPEAPVAETEPPAVDEPLAPEPEVEEPPAAEPEVEEPDVDEPAVEEPVVDEPLSEPAAEAVTDRPFGRAPVRADDELLPPAGARALPTRFVRPSERPLTGWLTPAIVTLAEQDQRLAAEVIMELLPAQAGIVRDALPYVLTVDGFGTYGVTIERDRTWVEPQLNASGADVHISGDAAALAPLVAGGARRRLPGVRIEGRKRRVRKLLRARRTPLDFARLADHGVRPAPELALAILCAAVEPSWTAGHHFSVVYALAGAESLEVEVRDGAPLHVRPATHAREEAPAATLSLREDALLSLLAHLHMPHGAERVLVAGDRYAVALLHGWFDRAQGLPGG
jgi:chromosome segregation ATPase